MDPNLQNRADGFFMLKIRAAFKVQFIWHTFWSVNCPNCFTSVASDLFACLFVCFIYWNYEVFVFLNFPPTESSRMFKLQTRNSALNSSSATLHSLWLRCTPRRTVYLYFFYKSWREKNPQQEMKKIRIITVIIPPSWSQVAVITPLSNNNNNKKRRGVLVKLQPSR